MSSHIVLCRVAIISARRLPGQTQERTGTLLGRRTFGCSQSLSANKKASWFGQNQGRRVEIMAASGEGRVVSVENVAASVEIVAASAEGNVCWRRIPDMPLYKFRG